MKNELQHMDFTFASISPYVWLSCVRYHLLMFSSLNYNLISLNLKCLFHQEKYLLFQIVHTRSIGILHFHSSQLLLFMQEIFYWHDGKKNRGGHKNIGLFIP